MQGWAMAVIVGEASWRLLHVMAPVTGVLMTTVALCRWLGWCLHCIVGNIIDDAALVWGQPLGGNHGESVKPVRLAANFCCCPLSFLQYLCSALTWSATGRLAQ